MNELHKYLDVHFDGPFRIEDEMSNGLIAMDTKHWFYAINTEHIVYVSQDKNDCIKFLSK